MSGNIHDTDISLLNIQISNMKKDILKGITDINHYNITYEYLKNTSNTLFKYIYDNYNKDNFDEKFFDNCISLMFKNIKSIQKNNTSQHDASVNIGSYLGKKYIPQLK